MKDILDHGSGPLILCIFIPLRSLNTRWDNGYFSPGGRGWGWIGDTIPPPSPQIPICPLLRLFYRIQCCTCAIEREKITKKNFN